MGKTFGENLRRARNKKDLSQEELAALLPERPGGESGGGGWISKLELNNFKQLKPHHLVYLAEALEVDVRRLLTGYEAPSTWIEALEAIEGSLDARGKALVIEVARLERAASVAARAPTQTRAAGDDYLTRLERVMRRVGIEPDRIQRVIEAERGYRPEAGEPPEQASS